MAGVIMASQPSWMAPFAGLSPRSFGTMVAMLRREGADPVRAAVRGRAVRVGCTGRAGETRADAPAADPGWSELTGLGWFLPWAPQTAAAWRTSLS